MRFALDGPYGRAPDPSSRERLVLVAGGIGVTPMHAVLEELLIGGVPEGAPLRRVTLVWSARYPIQRGNKYAALLIPKH